MSFSLKKHERMRDRLTAKNTTEPRPVDNMPSKMSRGGSGRLPERIAELEKDRKSFAHLRQSMIVPPRALEWWEKEVVEYAFSHPYVRARLERLMGSNITRLTDRRYMQRLAERIQEDNEQQLAKRIRAREEAEVEREKKLILEGKIPVEQVPQELADHPVFKISRITSQAIEFRRSKVQHPTMRASYIPTKTLQALANAMSAGEPEEEDAEEVQMLHEPETPEDGMEEMKSIALEVVEKAVSISEAPEEPTPKVVKPLAFEAADRAVSIVEEPGEDGLGGRFRVGGVVETAWKQAVSLVDMAIDKSEMPGESDDFDIYESSEEGEGLELDDEEAARAAAKRASHRAREMRLDRLSQKDHISFTESKGKEAPPPHETLEPQQRASLAAMLAAHIEWETEQAALEANQRQRDKDYTLSETEFRRLKYEAPLIEELRKKETVTDLYRLADEIVGALWIGKAKRPSQLLDKGKAPAAAPETAPASASVSAAAPATDAADATGDEEDPDTSAAPEGSTAAPPPAEEEAEAEVQVEAEAEAEVQVEAEVQGQGEAEGET